MDYKWVHSSAYSAIPPNALVGGNDKDGDPLYVGRAFHDGNMLVAKVIPSKQIAFVSLRGEEIPKTNFEILTGENLIWQHCYDHVIPEKAIVCGSTALGQPVYIGRGHYEGSLTIGKVSSVHRALFISWYGLERRLESYEVLVAGEKRELGWSQAVEAPLPTPPPPPPPPPISPMEKLQIEELSGQPYPQLPETKKVYPQATEYMKPYPYPYPPEDTKPIQTVKYPPAYTPMPMPMPMPQPQSLSPHITGTAPPYMSPAETYCPPPPPYDPVPPIGNKTIAYPVKQDPSTICRLGPPPRVFYLPREAKVRPYVVWVNANSSYTPPNGVYAGHDTESSTILVGRAFHRGELIPGKVMPSRGIAYVSFAGEEIAKYDFEVLVGQGYHWVPASHGVVPMGAIEAGRTSIGEPLFVGRAPYCGSLTPGKVQRSHRCLYIAFGGTERRIDIYEVLVRKADFR